MTGLRGNIFNMVEQIPGSIANLGRLESMDPRVAWPHEARNFTPWLFENADRLGEKLGIEIEFETMEQPVGGFYLDLIGRDRSHGVVLIVENQLGESDHSHLGQLLTYAAGTDASTIIWITTKVRDEHRQALTWLNEHTDPETFFFGVEVKLVKIGDSIPAPDFDVVVMPNDWQKVVRQASSVTVSGGGAKNDLYRQFWTKLLARIKHEHPNWTRATPPAQNWLWMASPIKGCGANAVFGHGVRRVELYIDRTSASACEDLFDALFERRAEFEAAYGGVLDWDRLDNRKACKISEQAPGEVGNIAEHEKYVDWFVNSLARLRVAIAAVDGPAL